MAKISWVGDGYLSGYGVRTSPLMGWWEKDAGTFAFNNQMLDSQIITRAQYSSLRLSPGPGGGFEKPLTLDAELFWNTTGIDLASPPRSNFTAGCKALKIIRVKDMVGSPTGPEQTTVRGLLMEQPGVVYLRELVYDTSLDYNSMAGPNLGDLAPGEKYWAVACMAWIEGSKGRSPRNQKWLAESGTISQDGVFFSDGDSLASPETRARAISFWTNRPLGKPVISSPVSGSAQIPGDTFNLEFSKPNPDAFMGGTTTPYSGVNGMEVQYAPLPTVTNPSPTWTRLAMYNPGGVVSEGWHIESGSGGTPAMFVYKDAGSLPIQVSTEPTGSPLKGYLPAGNWQVRLRLFDPASPNTWDMSTNSGRYPIKGVEGIEWRPGNYPPANISEWSDPIEIIIPSQIPPPIPTYPINGVAIQVPDELTGAPFSWVYRNTGGYDQLNATIRLRKVGDPTEYYGLHADSSPTMEHFPGVHLQQPGEYEWQVQTRDSTYFVSDWSEWARFWVVPRPNSGATAVLPSETIDGATLGCGTHRVYVYKRGGTEVIGEIRNPTFVEWNRLRDDMSQARIKLTDWDVDCGNLLSKLKPWAHEIVIFRDNGYSNDRVWEGPITSLTYKVDEISITAKDMMGYAYRRIIKSYTSDAGTGDSIVSRAVRILQQVFAPDDPNLLPYLVPIYREDDAKQYRTVQAYSVTAYEEIDDMASNAGLDYTVVGRSILIWGTKHRIGTLPEFRDKDLGSPPIVSVYGMSMANRYVISDGSGLWGEATRLDENDQDLENGLVEVLSSTWASDSDSNNETMSAEEAARLVESFTAMAERAISSRYPAPTVVRIPDNTTLNPSCVISIQHLVPGVAIPLRSTGTLKSVVATQKLDAVKVVEENGKETISITLSPFSRDDADQGEEGGDE